jgi:hypothetical protein
MTTHNTPKQAPKVLSAEQIEKTVTYLNRSFRDTAEAFKTRTGLNSNVKGTVLNGYQTDFAYLINDIQRGPVFLATQAIADANQLIAKMDQHPRPTK